jgi:3-hydroxyisobutyrate dehydrogenase-like beta-hydroxyacid dehydrogenase
MRVGLCGLGTMGTPMARNLAAGGLLGGVWNRTADTATRLAAELSTTAFTTPARLAAASDVIISMVSDGAAVVDLAAGPDGILAGIRPGTVWVEMSTIGPEPLPALAGQLASVGCTLVDAPVSGSVAVAERGALTILVGGAEDDVVRVRPALEALGTKVLHLGALGAGATMKLAVNSLIFAINEAVAEALVLAEAAGISRDAAYDVFEASAADSAVLRYRRPQFVEPDTAPTSFRLALAGKDLALIRALADRVGAAMPQAATTAAVIDAAIAAGLGDADVAFVAEHLRGHGPAAPC